MPAWRPDARPGPRPYTSPYVAGVGLGLVLLAAFLVAGRGLGATGAFATAVGGGVAAAAPDHAAAHLAYVSYSEQGLLSALASDWLVWQLFGVLVGGFLSALAAGRLKIAVERGAGIAPRGRMAQAVAGGALMGAGAMLARGCTSGLALSGGAVLSAGAWIFVVFAFGAGYAFSPLMRGRWLPHGSGAEGGT